MSTSTAERLAERLAEIPDMPEQMITAARAGYFSDFDTPLGLPKTTLIAFLHHLVPNRPGLADLLTEIRIGRWDDTRAEASAFGRRTLAEAAQREAAAEAAAGPLLAIPALAGVMGLFP